LEHLSLPAVTVDLPGRGRRPADLATVTIPSWIDAIVEDIDTSGFDRVILVGHSLAGLTIPAAAARRPNVVAHLIFLSSTVPPEGKSALHSMAWPIRLLVGRYLRRNPKALHLSPWIARTVFCNGMTKAQTTRTLAELVPEAIGPLREAVSRTGMPQDVPRTWILSLRDRAIPVFVARRQIRNLGGARVLPLEAGHHPFTTQPAALAVLLNRIAYEVSGPGRSDALR
jgi:pimeloyl-ACP methyl ester carboxylesterase